jgi:hypothetical protein
MFDTTYPAYRVFMLVIAMFAALPRAAHPARASA